jgi:hypothetical protein
MTKINTTTTLSGTKQIVIMHMIALQSKLIGLNTHWNHKNDADNVSLVSRFGVIQEVPIDVNNCQSNGSNSANKGNNAQVDWDRFRHSEYLESKTVPLSINNNSYSQY